VRDLIREILDFLGRAVDKLLGRDDRGKPDPKPPKPPKRPRPGTITAVGDSLGSIHVMVAHPTKRQDQTPLDPATELKGWQLFVQAKGASTWTPSGQLNNVETTERTIGNVAPGQWRVRVEWTDLFDQVASAEVDVGVPLPAPPEPGEVAATAIS